MESHDYAVRLAAFRFLEEQTRHRPDGLVPRSSLQQGFDFRGSRVPLLGPQGIFKPAILDVPLSITTVPPSDRKPRPYDDQIGSDGTIRYRYRGIDAAHPDNRGLHRAMQERQPLVYNYGIVEGLYFPVWPVFVVADDPANLLFHVEVDDPSAALRVSEEGVPDPADEGRRSYVTVLAKRRLHQEAFRQRVIRAYRGICAICRLGHVELLDAAHILPDGHPRGAAVIPNGLALCKLHHAAFDRHILGVRPDLRVEIRVDILEEEDGPMLEHGLQGFQGATIAVPRAAHNRPESRFLEERFEMFLRA